MGLNFDSVAEEYKKTPRFLKNPSTALFDVPALICGALGIK
jgi:hypothetical protein